MIGRRTMAGLLALGLSLAAGLASAQSWTGTAAGSDATRFGAVFDAGRNLYLRCNTPPAGGGAHHIDGNHSFPVNSPFALTLEIGDRLTPMTGEIERLPNAVLWVGQTGYRLPPMQSNMLYGVWQVELSMADPMILALYEADSLVLDPGLGQAWQFQTDGLVAALDTAFAACVEGWTRWGQTIPTILNRYWPAVSEPSQPNPVAPAQGFAPLTAIPPRVHQHVLNSCGTPYQLDPSHLGQADFDRDGRADVVLDWADVTCNGPTPRPFCGAANCSIDVFVSSQPPGAAPRGLLGVGYRIVTHPSGVPGLQLGCTAAACARGEGDIIYRWTGDRFGQ